MTNMIGFKINDLAAIGHDRGSFNPKVVRNSEK